MAEIKKSKRGGRRANAGRKPRAQKVEQLIAAGVLAPEAKQPEQSQSETPTIGRPTAFKPEYIEQAEKLCRLGATDEELADFFNVNRATIWRWAQKNDRFCNALKSGKEFADERVERSLYHKAIGYTYDAVKIFMPANAEAPVYAPYKEHVPPDTTAGIFWLKNRRSDAWRDKREVEHSGAIERAGDLTDAELARIAAGSSEGTPTPPKGSDEPDRVH